MNLAEAIQRSTRALQPAATTVPAGTLYYVTDESLTERSNGTAWESVSDAGTVADNTISTAKVQNDAITYAKIQNVTDVRLLGRSAGSAGDAQEITVGAGLSLAAGALSASGGASDWDSVITKAADQSVTNSSTLVDDTELQKAVLAGEVWQFELILIYSGDSATADFKWGLVVSAGTMTGTVKYVQLSAADAATDAALSAVADTVVSVSAGADAVDGKRTIWIRATLTFTTNNTFKLQFAQQNITAAKTVKTRIGSVMRCKKFV